MKLFWKPIEDANPGIDTISLTKAQAAEWKEWLRTKPDGTPRRHAEHPRSSPQLLPRRGRLGPRGSLDVGTLGCLMSGQHPRRTRAAEAPGPAGASHASTHPHARPHIDALVAAAHRAYLQATELQDISKTAPVGEPFAVQGSTYIKHASGKQADRVRINALQDGTEKRVDIPTPSPAPS